MQSGSIFKIISQKNLNIESRISVFVRQFIRTHAEITWNYSRWRWLIQGVLIAAYNRFFQNLGWSQKLDECRIKFFKNAMLQICKNWLVMFYKFPSVMQILTSIFSLMKTWWWMQYDQTWTGNCWTLCQSLCQSQFRSILMRFLKLCWGTEIFAEREQKWPEV